MIATASINELQKEFTEISGKHDMALHMAFCKKLVTSNDVEFLDYHYGLLRDRSVDDILYQNLRRAFSKRGPAGEDYLHKKLVTETDASLQGDVLQVLGGMKNHGGKRLDETAEWARKLLQSDVDTLRCRALWVLGWLGTSDDIDNVVSDRLFHDPNNENRGWAATAMMQIFFSDNTTAEKSLGCLKQAIRAEKDYFALEMILIAIQELTGKRFGLKSGSNERAPREKVDTALKKALTL
ncbi:MAG: HEAT repeat domain-containing protein [Desulfuromonadales bacterium]|nr:HEAT repeat domain-containing protein [Desulfuromonadales bacterium]